MYAVTRTAPVLEWVPPELRETDVLVLIACYAGDLDAGEAALAHLRTAIEPAADLIIRKPYVGHQMMFDSGVLAGWGYYWKSHYLPPLTDAAIDVIVEHRLAQVVARRATASCSTSAGRSPSARPTSTPRAAGTRPTR